MCFNKNIAVTASRFLPAGLDASTAAFTYLNWPCTVANEIYPSAHTKMRFSKFPKDANDANCAIYRLDEKKQIRFRNSLRWYKCKSSNHLTQQYFDLINDLTFLNY